MKKKPIIIAICVLAFFFLNFFGKAFLRRRNAINIVRAVLTCWEENNIPQSYKYWEDAAKSPSAAHLPDTAGL